MYAFPQIFVFLRGIETICFFLELLHYVAAGFVSS